MTNRIAPPKTTNTATIRHPANVFARPASAEQFSHRSWCNPFRLIVTL